MKTPKDIYSELIKPFPKHQVHFFPKSINKEGTQALALAYIDARAVMDRLDSVVGTENWQDSIQFVNGRTYCTLGIKFGNEWIYKSDLGSESEIEAEKGATSDSFKRAAVKFGIARYLYDTPAKWLPILTYSKADGKHYFKSFSCDPFEELFVKSAAKNKFVSSLEKKDSPPATFDFGSSSE